MVGHWTPLHRRGRNATLWRPGPDTSQAIPAQDARLITRSCNSTQLGFWKLDRLRNMSAFVNHESPLELDDYRPFLSKSSCFHANDAHVGARLGLPLLQHLAARIH